MNSVLQAFQDTKQRSFFALYYHCTLQSWTNHQQCCLLVTGLNPRSLPRRNTFKFKHTLHWPQRSPCFLILFTYMYVYARKGKIIFQINKRRNAQDFLLIICSKACKNWFNCALLKHQHLINIVWCYLLACLRLPTKCFILVGSAMFGATFNLVTCVELPKFLEHRKPVVWKLIIYHSTTVSAAKWGQRFVKNEFKRTRFFV